jgi:magnesium chelatase family protein
VIARANAHVRYPARFQLVAAMNPCRCGYLSDPAQSCGRAPKCASDYQARLSGPRSTHRHACRGRERLRRRSVAAAAGGRLARVAARVAKARDIQRARLRESGIRTNAEAEGELLDRVATPDAAGVKLADRSRRTHAADRARLSPGAARRAHHRRSAGADGVSRLHVAEALSYRRIAHVG